MPAEAITPDDCGSLHPNYSWDGKQIVFGVTEALSFDLYRRPTDLSTPQQLLLDVENNLRSAAWAAARSAPMVLPAARRSSLSSA